MHSSSISRRRSSSALRKACPDLIEACAASMLRNCSLNTASTSDSTRRITSTEMSCACAATPLTISPLRFARSRSTCSRMRS